MADEIFLIFSLCFFALSAFAQPLKIIVGSSPNGEDSTPLRDAYSIVNSNTDYFLTHGTGGGPGTNINGAALVSGSLNSNKLDTATAAQLALAGTGGSGPGTNVNGAALVSGSVNSNKLDSATLAFIASASGGGPGTNINGAALVSGSVTGAKLTDPLALNQLSANTATISNAVGNGAGLTNTFFFNLHYQVASNAFTNVIRGFLRFTNDDGGVYTWGVGTNLP